MTNTQRRTPVGIVGGSGYTGRELARILQGHARVEVCFSTTRSEVGEDAGVEGLRLTATEEAPIDEVELLFLCLPHGEAVEWVARIGGEGPRIVDLTADHRPGSGREQGVPYGLPELLCDEVSEAPVVANPGCYPTGVILALRPLMRAGLIDPARPVVVNAASGVTGAGRAPRRDLLFGEVAGDFRAYSPGNTHRHLAEMRALLPGLALLFTPHLLPVPRGILETIALPVRQGVSASDLRAVWRETYQSGGAVNGASGSSTGSGRGRVIQVLGERLPALSDVVGTDRLFLGAVDVAGIEPPLITVVAALDNLGKGAAGQAVQNMNLMLGFGPEEGLRC